MRKGKGSRTAQFVAYNRALGNLSPTVNGFSDPVAERLLSSNWTKRLTKSKRRLAHSPAKAAYPFWFRGMGVFNQYRTVVLDAAVTSALPFEQMIILGARFDSRAWRLPTLRDTIVFEVDHPDTQALKTAATTDLPVLAKEIRFVPVDFRRDELRTALHRAGHDPSLKTLWLWEGVTMYLTPDEVTRTLGSAEAVSAGASMLVLTYMARESGMIPRSLLLTFLGEPARSAFTESEIADLGRSCGWVTISNSGIEEWKSRFSCSFQLTRRNVGLQWNERIWVGREWNVEGME